VPRWRLTVRHGSRVEHERFDDLDAALSELERRMDALAGQVRKRPVNFLGRRYDAVTQVAARGELAGPQRLLPQRKGGVDMRGDGSTEAYTGRWRRRLIDTRPGETAYDALRRTLARTLPDT
jgi:hypothetical protein